jgi:3-phenylpropionate/trans-cinnamate dioxygenase ferredoxin reductase subunit
MTGGPGHVVVAGAGLAALRTIEELRGQGYTGGITLIGAERRPPYDRPPLSKKLMTGALDDTSLRGDLDALDVRVRLAESAVALSVGALSVGALSAGAPSAGAPSAGALATDRGEYAFDALVLATGASPVTLPGEGKQHVLRTLDDALELRALLTPTTGPPPTRLAIVGAGWIGAELATAAASLGCQVTVLEAGPAPLAAAVGPEVGALTAAWYEAAGVELRLRQGVASVEPGGLALAGGGWLPADVVVTAVGVRPATSWLAGSGVVLENGVAVDGQLRSSVPGVFAVGDCAAFESARYGRRLRFEHWDVALHAPEVAAANLLGGSVAYDPVPYFWSEQFGRMVQYAGYHGGADRMVWRGDPAAGHWAVAWLAGPALVALLTVGLPRDLLQGRRLIGAGTPVDSGKLADPGIPVRDCAELSLRGELRAAS